MAAARVKAVIFDLGRVVVDFDHTIAARRISAFTAKNQEEIYRLFFESEITARFEEGKISGLDFFRAVKEMLGLGIEYEQFLPIWNEIFFLSAKNMAVCEIAKVLAQDYRLALLTNINILHFEYIKNNFSVFDIFPAIIASFKEGFIKPHPEIYKRALGILGVLPEETFYTDDRQELIAEANKLGLRGFVFKGVGQLKEDLRANGIEIEFSPHLGIETKYL
ncbi:MAG: HAD family phosphatase [Candidatus Omnitrophota bacterium]